MSVHHTRCGCGAIIQLPNLKARAVTCDACHRARAHAVEVANANPVALPDPEPISAEYWEWLMNRRRQTLYGMDAFYGRTAEQIAKFDAAEAAEAAKYGTQRRPDGSLYSDPRAECRKIGQTTYVLDPVAWDMQPEKPVVVRTLEEEAWYLIGRSKIEPVPGSTTVKRTFHRRLRPVEQITVDKILATTKQHVAHSAGGGDDQ